MFKRKAISNFPLSGFDKERLSIPGIDLLSDDELKELNDLLNWNCFVVDQSGRRFGKPTSTNKRAEPQAVPDRRIKLLHERIDLSDKTVLEVGCFEGIHTVGLAGLAKSVKACDARITNVVKTAIRCIMFQVHPIIFLLDLEKKIPENLNIDCDVLYHVGVFYHMHDPLLHLQRILPFVKSTILLDTHYAIAETATNNYEYNGVSYRCSIYAESGYSDPFSGMSTYSRWLLLDDIIDFLSNSGMNKIDILEDRQERNGPRVLLCAEK